LGEKIKEKAVSITRGAFKHINSGAFRHVNNE